MALLTSVPQPIFGPTGFVAPAPSAVLTGVLADINSAFSGNLNLSLETPQGQLASSETAIIDNANDLYCSITNQMDPAFASGRMQDAIGRIYFITRFPAQPTVVSCSCVGLTGTVIPAGVQAQDAAGNVYTCTDGGTIDVTGSITLTFANNVPGPIACPEGTLTIIYQAILGWDTITNPADGVLGRNTESRTDFEARRAASVALNARGTIQAVQGAVLAVPNVLDAYSYQNDTANQITYGGATLAPNSIYVAVVGGDNTAVAQAIWSKKSPGCGYNGNTTITIYDTNSGYSQPYPSYEVTFTRPAALTVLFLVQIANSAQVPADAAMQVQNAIISAFAGADGGPRARIGTTIYASRYLTAIASLGAWAQVISLQLGSNNISSGVATAAIAGTSMTVSAVSSGTFAAGQVISGTGVSEGTQITLQTRGAAAASVTGSITTTTLTVTVVASGTLAAGQILSGTNVTPGTTIIRQLTGTAGSTGTYQVSVSQSAGSTAIAAETPGTTGTYLVTPSQTVSSTAITSAAVNQNTVAVNINQVPVTSAPDIQLVLI